jgi:hypothetical protein
MDEYRICRIPYIDFAWHSLEIHPRCSLANYHAKCDQFIGDSNLASIAHNISDSKSPNDRCNLADSRYGDIRDSWMSSHCMAYICGFEKNHAEQYERCNDG